MKVKEAEKKKFIKGLPYEVASVIVLVAGSIILDLDTIKDFIFVSIVILYSLIMTLKKENVLPINRVVIDIKDNNNATVRTGAGLKINNSVKEDTVKKIKKVQ